MDMTYWLKLLAVIIIPPLGVFLTVGLRGAFWLNILLTLCFYIPGFIHAAYILARSLPRHA
ncbi:MAG: YqaE/Pmp3 family membrane protein [Pseudomonadota bacterium]